MSDPVDPFERRLEDEPEPQDEEPVVQPILPPPGDACFPSDSQGMPKALKSIPSKERGWFWKNMRYRGFYIAHVPVQAPEHEYLFRQTKDGQPWHRAFYVKSPEGTIGLVPFPNSTIVWPWEQGAWAQDLAPENEGKIRPDLKPSEQKKR